MNAAEAACGIVSQREIFEGQAPRGNDDRHWTMCPRKDISSFQIAGHKKAPRSNRQKEQLTLGVTQMYGYSTRSANPCRSGKVAVWKAACNQPGGSICDVPKWRRVLVEACLDAGSEDVEIACQCDDGSARIHGRNGPHK